MRVHSCEFVSKGACLTSQHGRWLLEDEDAVLKNWFNCWEGASSASSSSKPGSARSALPLHITLLYRSDAFVDVPDGAAWAGADSKGCEIWLKHIRSVVQAGRPPRCSRTEPL